MSNQTNGTKTALYAELSNLTVCNWKLSDMYEGEGTVTVTFFVGDDEPDKLFFCGWYETETGACQFSVQENSLKEAINIMVKRDVDFGHTDMEVTFADEDVTDQAYKIILAKGVE